jgi:hypothetical protein
VAQAPTRKRRADSIFGLGRDRRGVWFLRSWKQAKEDEDDETP